MKLFVLIGKSASGKSTIEKELHKKGYNKITSCTTRQPRNGEIEGQDYYFLTEEDFNKKLINGDFLEDTTYRNWHYSIDKTKLENRDYVVVLEPHGYRQLQDELGIENVIGVLIYSPWYKRLYRSFKRDKVTFSKTMEIFRRLISDIFLFKGIKSKVDYTIRNNNLDTSVETIEKIIKSYQEIYIGDKVKITNIINEEEAEHLKSYEGQEGYVLSWIIKDNIKRYKILLNEKSGETAYFRRNELELVG